MRPKIFWWVVAGALCSLSLGCGARSSLAEQKGGTGGTFLEEIAGAGGKKTAPSSCILDADCFDPEDRCNPAICVEGSCQPLAPILCDDKDECTEDSCDPWTGGCIFTPLSFDLDRDGFKGPRPGKKAGEPGSCGDDCDDTSPLAYPGGKELCDGVDNDCNGIIDDEAKFIPVDTAPIQVSTPGLTQAYATGMAYSSHGYLASYSGEIKNSTDLYNRLLDLTGEPIGNANQMNGASGDAIGGPSVWTGDRFGSIWSDRRDGNYEIYFNTFSPSGTKLGPDVRLTETSGFSINPTLAWNGSSFLAVWQDNSAGNFEVVGQRISLDAKLIGENEYLATPILFEKNAEAPSIAATSQGTGIVYRIGDSFTSTIFFAPFDDHWKPQVAPVNIATGSNYIDPYIVRNGSDFIIVWGEKQPFRIFGAVVDFKGKILLSKQELSPKDGSPYRRPLALPLGDRVIVTYSRQQDDGYELFSKTFSSKLEPLSPQQQLTQSIGDDFGQSLIFGPDGDIGVLFDGKITNGNKLSNAAFFTRLRCDASIPQKLLTALHTSRQTVADLASIRRATDSVAVHRATSATRPAILRATRAALPVVALAIPTVGTGPTIL